MRQAGMELASADYYLLFDACAKAAQQGSSLAVEQVETLNPTPFEQA
jgi:hypothetical protein